MSGVQIIRDGQWALREGIQSSELQKWEDGYDTIMVWSFHDI